MAMRKFNRPPLFRNSIGFDHMVRLLDGIDAGQSSTYPPYNIEKVDEHSYRITMAVAGFDEADLDVQVKDNRLMVFGNVKNCAKGAIEKQYLHRGIAGRNFERHFNLAEHITVADANLVNGLLHIDLVREVPEAMKPRSIAINNNLRPIDDKAA